jgi:hypothetical protein
MARPFGGHHNPTVDSGESNKSLCAAPIDAQPIR